MNFREEPMHVEDIRSRLRAFDMLAKKDNVKVRVLVLGGTALALNLALENKGEIRPTRDIDVSFIDEIPDEFKVKLELLNINNDVEGVMNPDTTEIINNGEWRKFNDDYTNITVYLVSLEMLVAMKSLSQRQTDYNDAINRDVLAIVDKRHAISLIEDYKGDILNPDSMNHHYKEVLEILKADI